MPSEVFSNSPAPGRVAPVAALANNGGQVSAGATSGNVLAALPVALQSSGQFHALIDQELVIIPCQSGTALTGITRGAEGSTAAAHLDGALVYPLMTAGAIANALAGTLATATAAVATETSRATTAESSEASRATAAEATKAQNLVRTSVKTSAYTAAPGDSIPVDISAASVTVTLPTAPSNSTRIAVKTVAVNATPGTYSLTVAAGGSDVFNKTGGSTSLTLTAQFQGVTLQYDSGVWTVQSTDTPLGTALGAAKTGSDGTVGGPGGTSLTSSVVSGSALGATSLQPYQRTIELNIRDYTSFDFAGGSDMASMMATAGAAAAAIAVSSGRPVVIGGFRSGVVKINSTLLHYDRVKWRLDEARIFAGADLVGGAMWRALENLTPDTAIGVGTTASGSNLVNSVASIASWNKEDIVLGTGISAGTSSLQVASSAGFAAGAATVGSGTTNENVTILSIPDGTHLTLKAPTRQAHASSAPVAQVSTSASTTLTAAVLQSTKVLAVDVVNSVLVLDQPALASATVTLTRGATYYYNFRDCGLIGGTLDPNGFQVKAGVRAFFTERFVIEGTEFIHNRKTGDDNWAFQVGGRGLLARWPKVTGGTKVFQDGFHFAHGQGLRLVAPDIESGDDAVVLGGEPTDGNLGIYPDPIRDATIGGCEVRSARGFGLSLYVQLGATGRDWEVTHTNVEAIVGTAGTLRNGGMRIIDNNTGAAGTSQIRGVTVDKANLNVGSKGHDDAGTGLAINQSALLLQSVSDITFKAYRFGITDGAAATTGIQGIYINSCDNVTIQRPINTSASGLSRYLLKVISSNNVKVGGHKLTAGATVGPVYISGVTDLDIDVGELLSIPAGQNGITTSTIGGGTRVTTARVAHTRFSGVGGSGIGMTAGNTSLQRMLLDGNDFTEVALPISTNPSGRLGQQTTTTASALKTDTASIAVTDSSVFLPGDLALSVRTREWINIVGLVDGTHIQIVRAQRDSVAAAMNSGDVLITFRLTTVNNRGIVNYDPIAARDAGPGQAGVFVEPPGFTGVVATQAAASNNGRIVRFKPPYDMVVTKVGFGVSVADTVDTPVSAAIYDVTWARLGTSGAVTVGTNSLGAKAATLGSPVTLYAGQVYYVGLSVGTITTSLTLASLSAASNPARDAFGTGAGDVQLDSASTVHPLPATWVLGATSSSGFLTQVLEQ